jgi:hypothetical protein
VQHCHDAIQSTLSDRPEDCYRVDTAPLLQSVIESIKAESESRGVRISRQLPERDTEALCNPFLLRRVFKSILDTLLDDASRQDEIIIDAHSSEDRLCFRFRVAARQSSGGQQESFSDQWQLKDAVIEDPAAIALVHERSERFIEAARWLNRWDARLRIDCGTSYQLSVELELARENQSVALSTRLESASAVEAADV